MRELMADSDLPSPDQRSVQRDERRSTRLAGRHHAATTCDEHVNLENHTAHLEDAMLKRLSKRAWSELEADIRLLDKRFAEMVPTSAAFLAL